MGFDGGEDEPLTLPTTKEVEKEVAAGGATITFLEVALGILTRLEGQMDQDRKDEIRFVRDCLNSGPDVTQVAVSLTHKGNNPDDNDAAMKRNMRKTFSMKKPAGGSSINRSSIARQASEKLNQEKEESKESAVAKSETPKPNPVRKDYNLRGGLNAVAKPMESDGPAAPLTNGLPWMGPPVPTLPTQHITLESSVKVKTMFNETFDDWRFDVFEIDAISGGRPLMFVGWEALLRSGCFSEFNLDPQKASKFVQQAEAKYATEKKTPYHNNLHAADVTQTLWAMLSELGVKRFLDPMDTVVTLLSAIVHDMGHDGRTNAYHVNVQDKLAIRYNDKSVLENYHVSSGFKLLLVNKSTSILQGLPKDQLVIFRREVIDMVLGTDMVQHFAKLGEISEHTKRLGQDPANWQSDDSSMYVLRGMLLHAADISNQAKPMWAAQQWTTRVLLEFFEQGDAETSMGLPVSPLCDRHTTAIPESQIGFIQFIIQPTFEVLAKLIPCVRDTCVSQASSNLASWQQRKGTHVELHLAKRSNAEEENNVDCMSDGSDGTTHAITHL
eukprot:TRINITY_DN46508_c0_g1_i1.p1 TRINITY_DN46508_c0_g1~~TRINITY_DN46508_c0_g1_i1.p1  ORF type:complete len:555 (+),score=132.51 TRINITY_DN46508_c0_g1_i1:142-1806(+)